MPTGAPTSTDLYAVLGVDASATGDEIARAFRARAKQLHPDTSDDPDAPARFSDLVAAYDVLSNHRTRRAYDQRSARGATGFPQGVPGPVAAPPGNGPAPAAAARASRWTRRRAWIALVAGGLVALLGLGAAVLTWHLHERDAARRSHFRPVTATRVGDGDITFVTADGRSVTTREPQIHGEGTDLGPTVGVRYDPADPAHVVVDANTVGRDVTLAIVALKLLIGGLVFFVLGARHLRAPEGASSEQA